MKILFTVKDNSWDSVIDPRFGRTEGFFIYDEASDNTEYLDNSEAASQSHGAGPLAAQKIFDLKPDVLITGNGPGGKASAVLSNMNLEIYMGAGGMTVKEAYEAYKNGSLHKM